MLQIDENSFYGGPWTTATSIAEFEGILSQMKFHRVLYDASFDMTGRYYVDLIPKLVFCEGDLIQLLLGSGAHHYTEFKHIQGPFVAVNNKLRQVVCSKSDIFKDRNLTLPQKRSLMKFLNICIDAATRGDEQVFPPDVPLRRAMEEQGLDKELQDILLAGILLTNVDTLSSLDASRKLLLYLKSVGRYGSGTGPFLTPMYGGGELCQAFSRSSAVAGALQVLRCPIQSIGEAGIELLNGQHISSGKTFRSNQKSLNQVHRVVAIIDRPILVGQGQSFIVIPTQKCLIWAIMLGSGVHCAPEGKYLLHLSTEDSTLEDAYQELKGTLSNFVDLSRVSNDYVGQANKPIAHYVAFWTLDPLDAKKDWPDNVIACAGPDPTPTYESAAREARACFNKMYPDIEVFPLDTCNAEDFNADSDDETIQALESALTRPGHVTRKDH